MENTAMTTAVGDIPNALAQPLTYGCRVLLYRASQSGYVIATDSSQSPVGLQLEAAGPAADASSIRYEHAIFTIRPDDSSNGTAAGNRRMGDPLKYGHTIRLVHHTHQLPLSHHLEKHAVGLKGNFRVLLQGNNTNSAMVCERWRVMPRYRLRVEGELVADGDPVVLQSTAIDRYLNVAEELDEESDDQCLEVSCGRLIQGFQLQLYDGDVGDAYRETTLRCGDCVTLLHTEEHKYLMADLERSVCYLRSPESRLGNISQDANASIRKRSTVMEQAGSREVTGSRQRRAGEELNYLAVFVVEAADRRTGGALRPRGRGCYRLKGLSSGLYLCIGAETASSFSSSESDESGCDVNLGADDLSTAPSITAMPDRKGPAGAKASYAVVLTSDVTNPGTLFRIASAASSGGSAVLQNGGQVFLEAPSTPQGVLWVVAGAPIEDAETAATVTVASLSRHTTTGGSVSLCARRMKSMRDGMEVRRLTAKACEELHLIRGLLPPLERYIADMPRGVGDPHRVREIRANMRHLQQLCYTRVTSSPWNGNQATPLDGDLSPEWQSKLFHQGVAELTLQVARATLECPYVSVEKLSSSDMVLAPAEKTAFVPMRYADLGVLVDMCFDFVAVLVQERPRYAQSLSSHADFVMECCRHSASALRCVCALYCNNAMFVELPTARYRLNFFLDLLSSRSRDPMLLRVLRLFAMCGEEAMPEAQRVILAYLSDAGTAERVLCPTRLMQPPPSLHPLMSPSSNPVSVPGTATIAGAGSSTVVNPLASPSRSPHKKGRGRVTMQPPTCLADGTMVMVAIPHAIFATDAVPDGETTSVGTSTQYRGHQTSLGEILVNASASEELTGLTYFPIEGLSAVLQDWPELNDDFIPYYVEQVLLLASLASGGRSVCEQLVFHWVPCDVLPVMLESTRVPTIVHAAMVSLFAYCAGMFGPMLSIRQDIRSVRCIVTGTVASRPASASCPLVLQAAVPELVAARAYVLRYLQQTPLSGEEEVAAEYLATLHLTDVLVNGGVIAVADYRALAGMLVGCLNRAKTDQSTFLETPTVHACRMRTLQLLHSLMDVLLTWRALELVDFYRESAAPPAYSQLFQFTVGEILQRQKIVAGQPVRQPVLPMTNLCGGVENIKDRPLVMLGSLYQSLMSLAMETSSLRLRRVAVSLFFRLSNFTDELFRVANAMQLLTSEASLALYSEINRTCATLEDVCTRSFLRPNTLAQTDALLDALDGYLATAEYGSFVEKLGMMRHVGVPRQLLCLLQCLPLPLNDDARRIIFKVVELLQSMVQESLIREDLLKHVDLVSPLTPLGTNVISLLRTLYLQDANTQLLLPLCVMSGVVKCLHTTHTSRAAIEFLTDLLGVTDCDERPLAHHQQSVWQALVSDPRALRQVQFRHSWCGPKAAAVRERILTSPDYYVGTGHLSRHLAICHLLHRVAVDNDLVRPEEIRAEVFGLSSIDVMMAVVTDPLLPTFFREPYVALVDSLLLMDAAILPEVFGSRSFIDFVRMSVMDVGRYLQLRGGVIFFADLGDDIDRREDTVYRCLPSNTFERSVDDANFGVETYERHVFGPLLNCVRRVFMTFKVGVEHLNNRSRSQLKMRLNELVDMLCDLVQFVEGSVRCGKGRALLRSQKQTLLNCLSVCRQHGFHGTARWRGDAFDGLLQSLEEAASRSRTTSCCTVSSAELTAESKKAPPSVVVTSEGGASSQLPSASVKAGSEQAMSALWVAYLTRHLAEGEYGREDNLQLVAAGVLLRSCDRGTSFLHFLMCSISTLSVHNTTQLCRLVRQLVQLAPNNPLDDSVLLLYEHVTMESACLTIEMPLRSRQTLLSRWPGDTRQETPTPLLAVITELVDSPHASLRSAALRAATALLKGGHWGMQESYNTFCRRCANEQLFFTLRNHLTGFVEELRRYAQSLSRGRSPTAAAHLLPSMETTALELLLVKLLCARQYTPLQTYLIAQPDNDISVNLIETMVDLVAMSSSAANEMTTPFFLQLLSTVSETMQGPCRTNQECLVAYKAADYLTVLLADENMDSQRGALLHAREAVDPLATKKAPPNLQRESALRLQTAALSTLLALIEGRQDPAFIGRVLATVDLTVLGCSMDRSAALYERVHGSIERVHSRGIIKGDFKNSIKAMKRFWREYWRGDNPTGSEEIQDELALGVNVYIFFRACYDMEKLAYAQSVNGGGQFVDFVDKRGHTIQKVLRKTSSYLKIGGRVGMVEVIREGSLERVYFRILSRSEDNLTRRTKDSIIKSVARTSDNERLQSFFRKSTETIVEMNTYEGMRQWLVLFLTNYIVREMRLLAMGLILAVNLIMLIGVRAPDTPYANGTPYGIRFAIYILGILIIAVQGVLVLQALTGPVVIRVTTGWERRRIQQEEQAKLKMQRESIPMEETWYEEERETLPIVHPRSIAYTVYLAVTTRDFFQHVFFMFVCIMGFVHHPIWASVQLLQVVLNSPVLDNLIKALSQQLMSLVLTLLSLLFMIFIFTNISYYFFSELFDPLGTRGNGFNCYTLSQCWLVHVDTIRGGGGVGAVAEWPTFYTKDSFGYWFSFFRLMYHLFINMLMLNLFLGVIIDSLGQLRRAQELICADQRKKCFICGILRHNFDRVQAGTYERHTEEDHHMWHYVFFLHYLSEKDPSTFTGQEAYVDRLVQRRDITFYPIGRSIVLSLVDPSVPSVAPRGVKAAGANVSGELKEQAAAGNSEARAAALEAKVERLEMHVATLQSVVLRLGGHF